MGGKLTSLVGIEPVCTYARKKKEFPSGLEPQKHSIVRCRARCLLRHRDIYDRDIVKVIRNPLGLKSEVRIQEKYKKI